ncbi:btk-binding protein-related [Anaeramoeba flamelloides]|uniref:Btk-binding protein-related n=1 Tax=Anaeramoeba flamelloides TaxID=1746091 RepID=A0ABQ8YUZ2_9EUKA|nr:btk-binding protein-related [Anaeramoeba flamelloides]
MEEQKVYWWGYNYYQQFPSNTTQNLHNPNLAKFLPKQISLSQIVSNEYRVAFLTKKGEVYETGIRREITNGQVFQYSYKNEEVKIKKLCTGYSHMLHLSENGELFLTMAHAMNRLGVTQTSKKPKEITYFKENKITITDIACAFDKALFLSSEGILYAMGKPFADEPESFLDKKRLIYTIWPHGKQPCQVDRMWGGSNTYHMFIATTDSKLYAFGRNKNGQLGLNHKIKADRPTIVPNFDTNFISEIECSVNHTLILMNDGELYTAGSFQSCGLNQAPLVFTRMPRLEDQKFLQISCGFAHSLLLMLDKNEYVLKSWGRNEEGQLGLGSMGSKDLPTVVTIPDFNFEMGAKIFCGVCDSILYNSYSYEINEEFLKLFKSGTFSDYQISEIDCHKSILSFRTGKSPEEVKKHLEENYNKKQIENFLRAIYGSNSNSKEITNISTKMGIPEFPKKKLSQDLKNLYSDENSKDFSIIVTNDEEKEEENDVEIPVHKFLLIVRSGLFREMFQNINQDFNKVKDYSGKTVESLEILIKFFYTNEIKLIADDDPVLISEELEDAIDYYKLNKFCGLDTQLNNIMN